jgi:ABC-2 type transport system ATP-binding protein
MGGEVIKLQTRSPTLDEIKELNYVTSVNKTDKAVVLTVKNANAHLQEILSKVGQVESVEIRTPTLNDVFLHYTGREIREEAGEGGVMERIAHMRRGN